MKKRSHAEVDRLYQKAAKLIETGTTVGEACGKVGIASSVYYKKRRNQAKNVEASRRVFSKTIPALEALKNGASLDQDSFVVSAPLHRNSFIVFGSPSELAAFAREYHG